MKPLLYLPQRLRLLSLLLFLMLTATLSAQEYRICLASFTDSVNAGKLAEQLRLYGMETYNESIRIEGKNYIRVILDRAFPTAEAAQAALRSLQKHPVMVFFQARSPWLLPTTAAASTALAGQTIQSQQSPPSPAAPPASGIAEASALLSAGQSVAAFSAANTESADSALPEEPLQAQNTPEPAATIVSLDQAVLLAPQVSDKPTSPESTIAAIAELEAKQPEPEVAASEETPDPLTKEQPAAAGIEDSTGKAVELAQAELLTPEIFARNPAEPTAENNVAATADTVTTGEAETLQLPAELPSAETEASPEAVMPEALTAAEEREPAPEPDLEPVLTTPEVVATIEDAVPALEPEPDLEPEMTTPEVVAANEEAIPAPEPEAATMEAAPTAEGFTPDLETTAADELAASVETEAASEPDTEPETPTTEELALTLEPETSSTQELAPIQESETTTAQGQIHFSTSPVPLNAEHSQQYPLSFSAPAPIYARAFFSEELGNVAGGDLWHELYIDGNFTKRVYFEQALEPERLQIPLSITASNYADEFGDLGPGEYTIHIQVLRNKRDGQSLITRTGEDGLLYTEPVDILVAEKLSEGSFTYIVP
ncbi:MAG: SPOR domain-containing protein [Spirochaetes bacterium]|nr:SPOR domain-containing protein [Spirochaetota bacterium]